MPCFPSAMSFFFNTGRFELHAMGSSREAATFVCHSVEKCVVPGGWEGCLRECRLLGKGHGQGKWWRVEAQTSPPSRATSFNYAYAEVSLPVA